MCLAAFAISTSSRWPLVLASNRDEFFDRPALPLATWQTAAGQRIISGRDEQAGGSWLGMSPNGRVALLTNVRETALQAQPQSRGELVIDWLSGTGDARSFAAKKDGSLYGGFNIVLGDLQQGQWYGWSNRPAGATPVLPQPLADGVYGLSNAALDTPWPKTVALKSALRTALNTAINPASPAELQRALFKALSNPDRAAIGELPKTGVPLELEHALSSAHVSLPERNYGTRCASVIVVSAARQKDGRTDRVWDVSFTDTSFVPHPDGSTSEAVAAVNFSVPLPAATSATD